MKSNFVLANRLRITVAVAVAGCAVLITSCENKQVVQTPPPPQDTIVVATPEPSPGIKSTPKTVIYKVGTNSKGEANLQPVEIEGEAKDTDSAAKAIAEMAALKESPLPEDAKVLSVKFEDTLAIVDFNKSFADNFPGGDRKEALVFNALTSTLGQFPNVKQVQILVEGKKVPLGGTQDTTEPLGVPAAPTEHAANHTAP